MVKLPAVYNISISSASFHLCAAVGATTLALFLLYRSTVHQTGIIKSIESPLPNIKRILSKQELSELPYPPDAFPGARDVETPYGSIRVFEWGPENGRKALLLHGISTPCIALGGVAEGLVERGCRVMIFDLFGRGYSDTPLDIPYDIRLYTTQILLVLASSPLPWTGQLGIDLIGYSLGGGVSASFTRYFPHLIRSLVLLNTGGLIRPKHIGWRSRILYSTGVFPESLLAYLVKRRLQPQPSSSPPAQPGLPREPESALGAEVQNTQYKKHLGKSDASGGISFDNAILSKRRPGISISSAVGWQLAHHKGFIPAFMSSIRYAPIYSCHDDWRIVGARLSAQRANPGNEEAARNGLHKAQVLIVLGATDPVIVNDEIREDAEATLGAANVDFLVIRDAGHELPITKPKDVVDGIWDFWGMQQQGVGIDSH